MCEFNTGCPGHQTSDGFFPCESEKTCASGFIKNNVVLSTRLMIGEGVFYARPISHQEAQEWVSKNNPINYCGHQTVKLLGLEPATSRDQCTGYSEALCLSAKGRLDFGREYTVEEILEIGVDFTLVTFAEDTTVLANVAEVNKAAWLAGLESYPCGCTKDVLNLFETD